MKRVRKSLMALVLALVMSLTLLPVQAMAMESGLTGKGEARSVQAPVYINPLYAGTQRDKTGLGAQALSTVDLAEQPPNADECLSEVEAAKELHKQMLARKGEITLHVKQAYGADASEAVGRIWRSAMAHMKGTGATGDYLRYHNGGYYCPVFLVYPTDNGASQIFTVTYQHHPKFSTLWYTTAAQEQELTNYIHGTILPQLALDGKTTYQKAAAIYDWIAKNVRYDYDNLNDGDYMLKYTAYAAAIDKKAVCQGYANLFYRLANSAGIDCRIITGRGNSGSGWIDHAWNIVQMNDGKYYCVDVTWDEGRSSHSYFLKGLTEFSKNHVVRTENEYTYFWNEYASKVSATDYRVAEGGATPVVPKPATPANVTLIGAAGDSSGITVTWNAADGAAQYRVYRKDAVNTKWKGLANVTGTSWTDKTAAAGVTYTYTVRGIGSDGKSLSPGFDNTGVSAAMPAAPTPAPTTPANVTLIGATGDSNGVIVTWNAADGAAQYRVYRKDAANPKWKGLANVDGTSWTDKTAAAGVTYTYTVRGIGSDGKTLSPGFDATGVSATVPGAVPAVPADVTLGNATVSGSAIVVTWNAADGAAQYRVYRKDAANPKWKGIANVTGTSWTDKAAKAGVKYTYTVRGISADGKTLSPGFDKTGVSATIPGAAPVPANVTLSGATVGSSGITVAWRAAAGAEKYRVYRKDAANPKWKGIANVTGTSWTDKTAKAGVKYTYTVRGIGADGKTLSLKFDKTGVSATIPKPAKVAMVGAEQVTTGTKGIQVTWKPAANAKTYNVYRAVNPPSGDVPASAWVLVGKKVNALSFKDTTGKSGMMYAYTVRGVAADGETLSAKYNTFGLRVTMP